MPDNLKESLQGQDRKYGLPPGTVLYVGKDPSRKPRMQLISYDAETLAERPLESIEDLDTGRRHGAVQWLNVEGLHDVSLLEQIGQRLDIHPLTLSDIANTHQRPKFELFDDYAFLTLKMLRLEGGDSPAILAEHVGLVLGKAHVVSFQEAPGDVFDIVRDRIRTGRGRIRKMKAGYLVYSLLDAVLDGYFSVLEALGDRISDLEDDLLERKPSPAVLREIHALKQQVIYIRRCAWPLRELVGAIQKSRTPLVGDHLDMYFRDLYDHAVQAIDTIETYRDLLSSLTDLCMSIAGMRMNEIMKVLTIIATLFIPLTFVAGIYGMNFDFMPELRHPLAYPVVLGLMLAIALGMLAFFRRKGWF
jgi:magnesium transporter